MDFLIQKSENKARQAVDKQKRYLFEQIDWSQKLIVVQGYRGTGKTTCKLPHFSTHLK
jgi:uncharacterized protein